MSTNTSLLTVLQLPYVRMSLK